MTIKDMADSSADMPELKRELAWKGGRKGTTAGSEGEETNGDGLWPRRSTHT